MTNISRRAALATVREVLAADYVCDPACFGQDGIFVTERRELPGRRMYAYKPVFLQAVTMGEGVVLNANVERHEWLHQNCAGLTRDDIFSAQMLTKLQDFVKPDGQAMVGPDMKYICTRESFVPLEANTAAQVHVLAGAEVARLYQYEEFSHALEYDLSSNRPDVLAAVAELDGQVVGVAGCSADCAELWQVGIDVLPNQRRSGIGKILVNRVTAAILEAGKIPYYSTFPSNVVSRSLAVATGYFPCWTELYTADL
jgi:GNAT superfamily N-acetyltransferase